MRRFKASGMVCGVLVLAATGALNAAPETYRGAVAWLDDLQAKSEAGGTADAPLVRLQADTTAFRQAVESLSAEEAARGWLALYDRFTTVSASDWMESRQSGEPAYTFAALVAALPPESAWEALAAQIASRPAGSTPGERLREHQLALLLDTLLNEPAAARARLGQMLVEIAGMGESRGDYAGRQLREIDEALLALTGDGAGLRAAFEAKLKASAASTYDNYLNVPDLVTLLGAEAAEALLREALQLPKTHLSFTQGEDTRMLARRLALEEIDTLQQAPWDLAQALDATALFEALDRKFPVEAVAEDGDEVSMLAGVSLADLPDSVRQSVIGMMQRGGRGGMDYARRQATLYYLLGLIVAERSDDARRVASELSGGADPLAIPGGALQQLERLGYVGQVWDFLDPLLAEHPELPLWNEYIQLSANHGKADIMLERLKTASADPSLTPVQRRQLEARQVNALLAADKVEAAMSRALSLLETPTAEPGESFELALTTLKIGHLLERGEWIDAGLRAAHTSRKTAAPSYGDYQTPRLVRALLEMGRGVEAEALCGEWLAQEVASDESESHYGSDGAPAALAALAEVYHHAGRHADVLLLADRFPWWGVADLVSWPTRNYGYQALETGTGPVPLAHAVAVALEAEGRGDEAFPILEHLLNAGVVYDPAYAHYAQMRGPNALEFLDALYARDRYEERPLIWKADVLRQAGRLTEAEAAARAAIALDPSDGEQGKGNRMRVYAVLAEILAQRGDDKSADFFRDVVRAIRVAESADALYEAGLLLRGVKLYRDALALFADAYCIQSRMAVQLEAMGDFAAAEAHYQRAYELMPDSFGRVESHCFGCEGVFSSPRAQGIAERVFTSLAVNRPDAPQVHYLMGYLRESQDRFSEALEHYRKAVALDPEYLNAWKKMEGLGERMLLPAADRDAMVVTLIRLDPLGRHGRPDMHEVRDLRLLWRTLASVREMQPETPASLYPFPASAVHLENRKTGARSGYSRSYRFSYGADGGPLDIETLIREHAVLREIVELDDAIRMLTL